MSIAKHSAITPTSLRNRHRHFQLGSGRLDRNENSANANLNDRKGIAHTIDRDLIVDEILAGQVEPPGDEVGGFKHNPTQAGHAWNMEEWYRLDL